MIRRFAPTPESDCPERAPQTDPGPSAGRARMRAPNIGRVLALLRSALLAVVARSGHRTLPEAIESMARDPSAAIALIQRQRLT